MPLAQRAVAGSQGHALSSRSSRTPASPHIFWRPSRIRKLGLCKTLSLGPAHRFWGNTADNKFADAHSTIGISCR